MATSPRKIETPFGSRIEKVWEPMAVLGVSSYVTQTGNQPNDFELLWQEYVDIDVPPGTLVVIPSVNFWCLAHGTFEPEFIDALDDNGGSVWHSHDRPYGLGWASVGVIDVNEVDESSGSPTQTAQLLVKLHLADYNMDDPWVGLVGYSLTFFGAAATSGGSGRRNPPPAPSPSPRQRQLGEIKPFKLR